MTAVEGDGYNEYKSPHSKHEKFEGITVGRVALVRSLYSSILSFLSIYILYTCVVYLILQKSMTITMIADGVLRSSGGGAIAATPRKNRGGPQPRGKVFQARSTALYHLHPPGLPHGSTR